MKMSILDQDTEVIHGVSSVTKEELLSMRKL